MTLSTPNESEKGDFGIGSDIGRLNLDRLVFLLHHFLRLRLCLFFGAFFLFFYNPSCLFFGRDYEIGTVPGKRQRHNLPGAKQEVQFEEDARVLHQALQFQSDLGLVLSQIKSLGRESAEAKVQFFLVKARNDLGQSKSSLRRCRGLGVLALDVWSALPKSKPFFMTLANTSWMKSSRSVMSLDSSRCQT